MSGTGWGEPTDQKMTDSIYADRPDVPAVATAPAEVVPVAPPTPTPRYERRMPALLTVMYGLLVCLGGAGAVALAAWDWKPDVAMLAPLLLAGFGALLVLAAIMGLLRRR